MKKIVSAVIYGVFSFAMSSSFAADEKELALDVAKSVIKRNSPIAYNAVNGSKEELARAAAMNSKLVLNEMMQSDSTIEEEIVLRYALTLLPEISTVNDDSDKIRMSLGGRLAELEKAKRIDRLGLPEATISMRFHDGRWEVTNGEMKENVLVYPANHKVTLSATCEEGIHVLENRKRGLTFDVVNGEKIKCWFVTSDLVGGGHWSCGEKCSPAHKEAEISDSVIGADVWRLLYVNKRAEDDPK